MSGADAGAVAAALSDAGLDVTEDRPLGLLTTYRVGGNASWFVNVGSVDELDRLAAATATTGVATLVIGRGSNLLVADAGFDGGHDTEFGGEWDATGSSWFDDEDASFGGISGIGGPEDAVSVDGSAADGGDEPGPFGFVFDQRF